MAEFRTRAWFGPVLYLAAAFAASALSGVVKARYAVHCNDILDTTGRVFAGTGFGPYLPIPAIQSCGNSAVPLCLVLIAGVLALSGAWFLLLRAPLRRGTALLYMTSALPFVVFPYVSTTDVYAYAFYGYEFSALHLSPYVHHAVHLAGLESLPALFPGFGNELRIANYGPVFVAFSSAIAVLSNHSLANYVIIERALMAAALFGLSFAVSRLADPEHRARAFIWIAFNPICMFEAIAFGHADVLMLLLGGAAVAAFARGRFVLCGVLAVFAAEIRSVGILVLVATAMCLFQERRYKALTLELSAASATAIVTAVISIGVFGHFTVGGAPAIAPWSSPALVAAALFGGSVLTIREFAAAQAAVCLTLMAFAIQIRRWGVAVYALLAALPTAFPWYFTWTVPIGAIAVDRRFKTAIAVSGIAVVFGEAALMTGAHGFQLVACGLQLGILVALLAGHKFAAAPVTPQREMG